MAVSGGEWLHVCAVLLIVNLYLNGCRAGG
jgi:hypothetical protein